MVLSDKQDRKSKEKGLLWTRPSDLKIHGREALVEFIWH